MAVVSDPVADLLTRIRNAGQAQHRYCMVGASRLKRAILEVLKELGYIRDFIEDSSRQQIRIMLKYTPQRRHIIRGLHRVSRPGCRRYIGYRDIPGVFGRMGAVVLSTPQGLKTGHQALEAKLGGELLFQVW